MSIFPNIALPNLARRPAVRVNDRPVIGKIRLLQAMTAADLADFGAKPGDVARIVAEIGGKAVRP